MAKKMAIAPAESIGNRVRQLVDEVDNGNIVEAAERVRLPRRTLAHLASAPASYSPRLSTLQRIADAYNVRFEWLLTGKGERQQASLFGDWPLEAAALALQDVLRELELPEAVQTEYTRAAFTAGTASRVLLRGHGASSVGQTFPLNKIVGLQVAAWAALIRELVDRIGKDETRARLIAVAPHAHRFHEGYSPSWIESGKDIANEAGLVQLHQRFHPPAKAAKK